MPRLLKRRTPPRPRRRQRLSLLRGESSNPDSPSVTTPSHPLSSHRPAFFVLSHLLSSPCFVSTFFSTFFSTCHPSRMLATFASPQFRWSESYVLVSLVRHFSKTSADCSRLLGPSRSRLTALPHLYPCPPYPTHPGRTLHPEHRAGLHRRLRGRGAQSEPQRGDNVHPRARPRRHVEGGALS